MPEPESDATLLAKLLEEERLKRQNMQNMYEKHLAHLRAENVAKIAQARSQVLVELDDTIKRYHHLAREAVKSSKKVVAEAEAREANARHLADVACEKFEQDCKDKLKGIINGYRYLADKAAHQADHETRALKMKFKEMTDAHLAEQQKLESELLSNAEQKLAGFKTEILRLESENRQLKLSLEHSMVNIKHEIAQNFQRFETMLISVSLEILWEQNILISEVELREKLTASMDARLNEIP